MDRRGRAGVAAAVHTVTRGRVPGQPRDRAEGPADPHGAGPDREPAGRRDIRAGRPDRAARRTTAGRRRRCGHRWRRFRPPPARCATAPNDAIAFHSGYPDRELLPERLVRAALTRAARGEAALSRPPAAGLPELQSWFAHELGSLDAGRDHPAEPRATSSYFLEAKAGSAPSSARWSGRGQPLLMESPDLLGRHPGRGAGRCPGCPGAQRPRRSGPGGTGPRLRRDRRARCSTPSRTTRTPPARNGRPARRTGPGRRARKRRVPGGGRLGT